MPIARRAGVEEGRRQAEAAAYVRGLADGRRQALQDAQKAVDEALGELSDAGDREPPGAADEGDERTSSDAPETSERATFVPSGPHRKVLDALAWFEAAGIAAPGRHQVGWAAGYRADTGHFGNILSDLACNGRIERDAGTISLTPLGRAEATAPRGKLTPSVLVERIKAKIGGPASKVLDELVRTYPRSATREDLAQATGYRADTGHFGNIVSELVGPEIATRPRHGEVRLSDWVMLRSR
ncbi:MAG: hypothetical protein F9K29_17900 [Hyphomicrobiaceae bacterium]|nr:MAG: hypothetical protein F9K29_17900 [Hyphomicrobiaceae bacterium]